MKENKYSQWFIITAIGGKEDSIVDVLTEKIKNFGYEDLVEEIKLLKHNVVEEEIFSPKDPKLPKQMRDSKTIKWVTLPNGSFKKTKTRVLNKFPGYIFIKMVMDQDIWYAIRNTPGVLGFVGSSGKGALPIPISITEFENIQPTQTTISSKEATPSVLETKTTENKKSFTTTLKVGYNVQIMDGNFAGENGEIKSIDLEKGLAIVKIEFFGRITEVAVEFANLKIS